MKIKKILAAFAAAAVAVSTMAINAFAADEYAATLGFSDSNWTFQDWESSVQVTGDGQYTLESSLVAGAPDFLVFVVDIGGMYADHPEASAVLDKVEVDGSEISFDSSKIIYGDIEEKGNFRIEIYNEYGDSKNDPGVNQETAIGSDLKITFTVSGLGGGAAASEETTASDDAPAADTAPTTSATTGNVPAAVMVSVMAVAGAAAVAAKKRK